MGTIKDAAEWVEAVKKRFDDAEAMGLDPVPPPEFDGLVFQVLGTRVKAELQRTVDLMQDALKKFDARLQSMTPFERENGGGRNLTHLRVDVESKLRSTLFMLEHVNEAAIYNLVPSEVVSLTGSMVHLTGFGDDAMPSFPMAPTKD